MKLNEADRERFEKYIDRSGGPDACHPWLGCLVRGHGQFYLSGRMEYAHRVAWVLAGREITEDRPWILHDCPGGDNRACCNERHLWDGTCADNNADMARKGRGARSKRGLPFGVRIERGGRFGANAWITGKMAWLGTYDTAEEAGTVALRAKRKWLEEAAS